MATHAPASGLLTVDDVARVLRASRHTVYRRVADRSLRALRVGETGTLRFEPEAIDALLRPAGLEPEENR
jgi:excisionase family DNA binding protein